MSGNEQLHVTSSASRVQCLTQEARVPFLAEIPVLLYCLAVCAMSIKSDLGYRWNLSCFTRHHHAKMNVVLQCTRNLIMGLII